MPSVDELLERAESQIVDDILYIDIESRQIQVPSTEILFGVENDKKAERKVFRCSKKVGNGLDLENANIYINYQNANGEKDSYVVLDKKVENEDITFSWELGKNVTLYKGTLHFIVCAKWSKDGVVTNEWNTTLADGTSLQGLNADEQIQEEKKDILEQLLQMYEVNVKKTLVYNSIKRAIKLEG